MIVRPAHASNPLVLAELADIHALVMGIHDYIMLDLAQTAHIPVAEAKKALQNRRKERAKLHFAELLKNVDLPKREGH